VVALTYLPALALGLIVEHLRLVIGGSLRSRNMIEHDAQQPDAHPPHVKSNSPEEVSELVEEPDQRRPVMHMQCLLRNEKIRLVIIVVGLLSIILSCLLFLFTRSVIPLFVTIVIAYLGYRQVDAWLDTHEPPYS
jgi:hypothetical protein